MRHQRLQHGRAVREPVAIGRAGDLDCFRAKGLGDPDVDHPGSALTFSLNSEVRESPILVSRYQSKRPKAASS
jgi:hypothetical protein